MWDRMQNGLQVGCTDLQDMALRLAAGQVTFTFDVLKRGSWRSETNASRI